MTKPILPVTRKMALKKLSDHAFEKATFELIFHRFWYQKTKNNDDGLQFSKRVLQEAIDRYFSKKNRILLYLFEGARLFNFNNNLKNEPQEDRDILENLARSQLLALVDKVYWNRFGDD
jgi:hypothetical protein